MSLFHITQVTAGPSAVVLTHQGPRPPAPLWLERGTLRRGATHEGGSHALQCGEGGPAPPQGEACVPVDQGPCIEPSCGNMSFYLVEHNDRCHNTFGRCAENER